MKHSWVKNSLLAILPALIFYLYQIVQYRVRIVGQRAFSMLPYTLFNMFAPILIGVLFFFIIAYVWTNRNSLVWIFLLGGSILVNVLYSLYTLNVPGFPRTLLNASSGSQLAYVLMGAYGTGFWVSLICYIKGKIKRNRA